MKWSSILERLDQVLQYGPCDVIYISFYKEYTLDAFLKMKKPWIIDKIEATITAETLCLEKPKDSEDHIERVFKVCLFPVSFGRTQS